MFRWLERFHAVGMLLGINVFKKVEAVVYRKYMLKTENNSFS